MAETGQRTYVAIVGSRAYSDLSQVRRYVQSLPHGTVVVTGDARGVDCEARTACIREGREYYALEPCWEALGRRAGPLRNEAIVRLADRVVAFWDGSSPGTRSTLALARRDGKPVEVFTPMERA